MDRVIGILMLLTVIMTGSKSSQNKISGVVKEFGTNQVIQNVSVEVKGTDRVTSTDKDGKFQIEANKGDVLIFKMLGFVDLEKKVTNNTLLNVFLKVDNQILEDVVVGYGDMAPKRVEISGAIVGSSKSVRLNKQLIGYPRARQAESYQNIKENKFLTPVKEPLSTFAADVDAASYSNFRRFINQGEVPPSDAVRIEEMINYFEYDLKAPTDGKPVAITTELTNAPWNTDHQLLRISLKAKDIPKKDLASSNFVFLIDVSGSMMSANKLPLVKSSLKMLVDQLRDQDKVAIVTYAGSAAVKLESTSGSQKMKIKDAINQLEAGGSTAGAAGIKKAYQIAKYNFIKGGNNRIIMATDGDFNVGESSDESMEELISKERNHGVYISLLGYGMGNLKDSKMEILANKGHGNYAYIDNISEARKAIITEFGGTMFTVAKDVKIQVEFNPHFVQAYRLVGYENRLLEAEDFNNDEKLGGDMGVGHAVTALYEIVPIGAKSNYAGSVDDLKYQENKKEKASSVNSQELATVKFRYKEPDGDKSQLQSVTVLPKVNSIQSVSQDFQFITAIAELGMLVRNSEFKQDASFDDVVARARKAKGVDAEGYRAEFIRLAQDAEQLLKNES